MQHLAAALPPVKSQSSVSEPTHEQHAVSALLDRVQSRGLAMLRRWPTCDWKDAAGVRWSHRMQAQQDSRSPTRQCTARLGVVDVCLRPNAGF
jgi:hypothetical protein